MGAGWHVFVWPNERVEKSGLKNRGACQAALLHRLARMYRIAVQASCHHLPRSLALASALRRSITGYSKEQTRQLFSGLAMAAPAMGAWWYFRVKVIQPHLDQQHEAKRGKIMEDNGTVDAQDGSRQSIDDSGSSGQDPTEYPEAQLPASGTTPTATSKIISEASIAALKAGQGDDATSKPRRKWFYFF